MSALSDLDVQQSLKATIETLAAAAREVETALQPGVGALPLELRERLDLISKKVEEAEAFFARALDSKALYDLLSSIHGRLGEAAAAERYARQGRMFMADEQEFQGRLQAFYGNNTKALSHFNEALRLVPDHAFAKKGAEGSAKRIEKSTKDLDKLRMAAESKRTSKEFLALGAALADLGRLDEALAAFDQAVVLDPASPDGYARRGTALHAKGEVAEALAMYQKAVAIKPTSMMGRRGVNYATFQMENPAGAGRPAED
ncbi:MAG TPA: tetratricopeptide repeat protein [Candidatus Thermoplasmatota archaeon]|nr:tetratricopeptide repeat protein [Candidatus Thermoplasmatota archaeon]